MVLTYVILVVLFIVEAIPTIPINATQATTHDIAIIAIANAILCPVMRNNRNVRYVISAYLTLFSQFFLQIKTQTLQ